MQRGVLQVRRNKRYLDKTLFMTIMKGEISRTDEQKGLKSIWITSFKPIFSKMKFVIV